MLYLHRSERADALLSALVEVMTTSLPDPMAAEVICVPSHGVERWLSQGLAMKLGASLPGRRNGATDGVAANIDFPLPGALVGDVVAMVAGIDPRDDPWNNDQTLWALVDAIDANMNSGWMGLVAAQIRAGEAQGRINRVRTARYISDLFSKYHQQRPEMIKGWADGADVDAVGQPLTGLFAWQPILWREMAKRLDAPSPPERIEQVCTALADVGQTAQLDLPERIFAFGLTRLPASHVQILRGLAASRDVHLMLLHPSPHLWDAVLLAVGAEAKVLDRRDDTTIRLALNPLLASWGRDARELQIALGASAASVETAAFSDRHIQLPASAEGAQRTLLHQLQDDVRGNLRPVGANYSDDDSRPLFNPVTDTSVQVHACHGEVRQVQVLRDAIMHLLDADPTLEPRDIIILCPDIEQFAPEIHAVFGGTPELRVRLADRSVAQTNPLISAVALLLGALDSRLSATEVVGLVTTVPVRERFDFADDDLDRIHRWVRDAGIRWGLDRTHRGRWSLGEVDANTWAAGLDRILLGVAMADEDLRQVGGAVPVDDVSSNDIATAGRLAEFIERLGDAVGFFGGAFSLQDGIARLLETVDRLMATRTADAWQRQELQRVVDGVRPAIDGASDSPALLNFAEFRDLVGAAMKGRPTRANFRTGHITVCTLTPMRSIPHRVVCLLGLDDQRFPRISRVSGDDLTRRPEFVGDQDGRSEDRQLLLDALLAAKDHLVITYSGRDERTNAIRPAAVPLAELLSVIDRTVRIEREGGIVVQHPLQSFDARNFSNGSLISEGVWSYDEASYGGAQTLQKPQVAETAFLEKLLTPFVVKQLALDDLVRFAEHPVKAFVKTRLGIDLGDYAEALADEFTLGMTGRDDWRPGEELIEVLSNVRADQSATEIGLAWFLSATARGTLPPGQIAHGRLRDKVYVPANEIAKYVRHVRGGSVSQTVPIRVALDDGRGLLGSVSGVCEDRLIVSSFSKLNTGKYRRELKGRHRIATWIRLLALAANNSAVDYTAYVISRDKDPALPLVLMMTPPEDPLAVLVGVIDLFDRGMRAPLPLYCDTSSAYAAGIARNQHVWPMKNAWNSVHTFPKEDQDKYHALVLDPAPSVDDLLADSAFVECAHALWDPLLDHESVVDIKAAVQRNAGEQK